MIYPWQENTWQHILNRYEANTFPHAWLITGKQGLGKNDFAQAVAKLLLCEAPQNSACNTCRACNWFANTSHPDFFHIKPEEEGKAIKVDQIRELIVKLAQTPTNGFRQVVIISPADAMNIAAANALLKTLEEPNGDVVLLLVTERPQGLPATIYSRCQPLRLATPSRESALAWLRAQHPEESELEILLDYAEGAPVAVNTLLENNFMALRNPLLTVLLSQSFNPLTLSEQCDKTQLLVILRVMWLCVIDLLRIKEGVDSRHLVAQDKRDILEQFAQRTSPQELVQIQNKITRAQLLKQTHPSINPQMLLDDILITWREAC